MNAPAVSQLRAMAWKEWHEVRLYLWIALAVFIGFPVVEGLEEIVQFHKPFFLSTSPWVMIFGAVLAIFVAVGATCRDFRGRLDDFWQSRPVGTTPWLAMKFVVGFVVVFVGCEVPLVLEIMVDGNPRHLFLNGMTFSALPFLWLVAYSIGFLAGCVVRRAAHAAVISLAGLLLVVFLPALVPPLDWMSAGRYVGVSYQDSFFLPLIGYGACMVVLAIVIAAAALVSAARGWHVDAGRKVMYAAISTALLVLFASSAFKLGTNLPILQVADVSMEAPLGIAGYIGQSLPGYPSYLWSDGHRGFVERWGWDKDDGSGLPVEHHSRRTLKLTDDGLAVGNEANSTNGFSSADYAWHLRAPYGASSTVAPDDPSVTYYVTNEFDLPQTHVDRSDMHANPHIVDQDRQEDTEVAELHGLYFPSLRNAQGEWYNPAYNEARICASGNRMFVTAATDHVAIFDISDPRKPKLISNDAYKLGRETREPRWSASNSVPTTITVDLPEVAGISAEGRLRLFTTREWSYSQFDGKCLIINFQPSETVEYQLTSLTDTRATLEFAGSYSASLLERLVSFNQGEILGGAQMSGGLLYVASGGGAFFNPHITIFDTRGPAGLRVVGHFAVPGIEDYCALPDGRALVLAKDKLYLVGPPRE